MSDVSDEFDLADYLLAVILAAFIVFGSCGLLWLMDNSDTVHWEDGELTDAPR